MLNQYDLLMQYEKEGTEECFCIFFLNTAKSSTINSLVTGTSRKWDNKEASGINAFCTKVGDEEGNTDATSEHLYNMVGWDYYRTKEKI